jgi:hypothetical protein
VAEQLIALGVEVLRLVPLVLALYLPALAGLALWKERGEGYKTKAALVLVLGLGVVIAIHLIFTSVSALQVTETLALSLVQAAVALLLAHLTVYKLAD